MPRHSRTGVRGLYRDADGRYRIDLRWRDPSRRGQQRYHERLPDRTSAAAAKRRAIEVLNLALAGKLHTERQAPPTLAELFNAYEDWLKANRPAALRSRRIHRAQLEAVTGRGLRVDRLAAWHLEKLKKARIGDGAKPATVNRALATVKHAVGLAAAGSLGGAAEWISQEQAHSISKVRLLREPPGRVRYLHEGEGEALLAACPEWLRLLVTGALLTGMRQGELRALRREHVDLRHRTLVVAHSKSNRSRRIPVGPSLQPVLEEAMRRSECAHVFTNHAGQPLTEHMVTAAFPAAVKRAGLSDLRFHDLRHDFASKLVRQGVPLYRVSKLLGHSTLAMTARYAHLADDDLRSALAGLEAPRAADPDAVATGLPRDTSATVRDGGTKGR